MHDKIPYGRQSVGEEEARRVREVVLSDFLTQGPKVAEFEDGLKQISGAKHAVAVSHGTTALYLACRAAGLGPGDRFVTSPITFVATANAGLLCGAKPVFVDIDPKTLNLDVAQTAQALKRYKRIKVVLPVHMGGRVCEMDVLAAICAERQVKIIEDACHAFGGRWHDDRGDWHTVGDGAFSAMTCFSFHPVKSLTTGEGGAVMTNDDELAAQLRLLRNHGITRDTDRMQTAAEPWHYEMHALSLNGRMTDLQAALGTVQLDKFPRLKQRRLELIRRYDTAFAQLEGIETQERPADDDSCWHLMIVRCRDRAGLFQHLQNEGIGTQVHYIPVHTQPYYQHNFGTKSGDCPHAEQYYAEGLSLPLYPDLTNAEQDRVIAAVTAFCQADGDD